MKIKWSYILAVVFMGLFMSGGVLSADIVVDQPTKMRHLNEGSASCAGTLQFCQDVTHLPIKDVQIAAAKSAAYADWHYQPVNSAFPEYRMIPAVSQVATTTVVPVSMSTSADVIIASSASLTEGISELNTKPSRSIPNSVIAAMLALISVVAIARRKASR